MAAAHSGAYETPRETQTVSTLRLAISTAVTAGLAFVVCWLATFIPFSSPTHAYISLFTNAEISSGLAVVEGTCWSLLFGLIVGAIFAVAYNVTGPLVRK